MPKVTLEQLRKAVSVATLRDLMDGEDTKRVHDLSEALARGFRDNEHRHKYALMSIMEGYPHDGPIGIAYSGIALGLALGVIAALKVAQAEIEPAEESGPSSPPPPPTWSSPGGSA